MKRSDEGAVMVSLVDGAHKIASRRVERSLAMVLRCLVVALVIGFVLGCARRKETGLYPGDLAPDFSLPTVAGSGSESLRLSDLKGRVVLVNFWASWCSPCISELPAMERLYARLKDRGFVILGVGVDDQPESLAEFQRKYALTFPLVVDSAGEVKTRYKLNGVPESFVVDREGKLVLLPDPADGIPAVRIIGPREWDSPDAIARIEALLK